MALNICKIIQLLTICIKYTHNKNFIIKIIKKKKTLPGVLNLMCNSNAIYIYTVR